MTLLLPLSHDQLSAESKTERWGKKQNGTDIVSHALSKIAQKTIPGEAWGYPERMPGKKKVFKTSSVALIRVHFLPVRE